MRALLFAPVFAAAVFAAACAAPEGTGEETGDGPQPMTAFSSDAEFEAYMASLVDRPSDWDGFGATDAEGDAPPSAPGAENEEITNNQEEGVDEGGIVKNIGDHLVVLRQGRLYAVSVAEAGAPAQTGTIRVAPDEALNSGVWYDEMLVRGRDIYVIGYRYLTNVLDEDDPETIVWWIHGATEVSHFVLDEGGAFERGETLFFESADYYSGRNYASRMTGGKLIFYMPYYSFIYDWEAEERKVRVPRFLRYLGDGEFRAGPPMFRGVDVFRPHRDPDYPTFHTVVACDLDRGLKCRSRSLVGDWSREFYVTRDQIYLWTHPWVVAFSLKNLRPTSHAVVGYPIDQFSFREEGDMLHVGVRVSSQEWPLQTRTDRQRLALLSLPLDDFGVKGKQEIGGRHLTGLLADEGWLWVQRNRHAEGWYLAAARRTDEQVLVAHHIATGRTRRIEGGEGSVSRIEAMPGYGALVVSSNGWWAEDAALELSPIRLGRDDGRLRFEPGLALDGLREGESRSHGFFFRPDEGGGVFGLPILGTGGGWHWWGRGVSNIAFFDVDAAACTNLEECAGPLSLLGAISASDESGGSCETSCIDWYGNTRPIFLRDRLFALMGSELKEAVLTGDGVAPLGEPVLMSFE